MSNAIRRVYVEGIALWSPAMPGWGLAAPVLRNEAAPVEPPAKRPAPQVLAAAERRRAPDSVALALEVAASAVAQSGRKADELPSVFVSAHADLAINDYMCATLVEAPTQISPTKFHNSVHNAAAGYWTIGTGCMHASTALSAFLSSFSAGLLEAATQCAADQCAVLLVACDVAATGPLATVNASRGLLAAALVLAPNRTDKSVVALDWSLVKGPVAGLQCTSVGARALSANASADCLPLFEALARGGNASVDLPLPPQLALRVAMTALH